MKFEKRFNAEIVPEWKIKYIDYKSLKKKLRNIQREKLSNNKHKNKFNSNHFNSDKESVGNYHDTRSRQEQTEISSVQNDNRRLSIQSQAFSMNSVTGSIQDFFQKVSSALVTLQKHDPPESDFSPPAQITSLSTLFEEVTHKERLFFIALDGELDKIERFYRIKETDAVTRMNLLVKQYEMLKERKDNEKKKEKKRSVKILVQQGIDYLTSPNANTNAFSASANARTSKSSSTISLESPDKITPTSLDEYYKNAEKNIKKAVFEFYRGAELLRKYRVLNYNGISKLLKTYDKVSGRNGFEIYIQKVKICYFFKSNVMKKLLKDAEEFYADNFENGSHSRTIRKLRTPSKKNKTYYLSTLRVGLFLGLALPAISHLPGLIRQKHVDFWLDLIHIYAGFLIPIILLLLIGVNMYVWMQSHVNYRFILELDPRNNLDFRQYLELPAIMFLVTAYTMLFNFSDVISISYIKPYSYPTLLTIFIGVTLLNPYPVFYYKTRKWFIISFVRLFGSGILRVEFRDYFLADLLTSLSYSMTTLQFFVCGESACNASTNIVTPILGSIPALFRFLQCYRRYSDTSKVIHVLNLCKYGSVITSIWATFGYNALKHKHDGTTIVSVFLALWWFVQMFTTTFTFGWDVKVDWSLLRLRSTNYLLRDELAYEQHLLYYFAIISNFFLRFSWISLRIFPNKPSVIIAIAFGEMIRRWQWNFFRVENEHVINCAEFRAVKEIPLPFEVEEIILGDDKEATDYDRTTSLTSWSSWSKKMFAKRRNLNPADSWKDFEPRNNTSEYGYSEIFEESEESEEEEDDENYNFDTLNARNTIISTSNKMRGSLGLSNIYASRGFLPINEKDMQ